MNSRVLKKTILNGMQFHGFSASVSLKELGETPSKIFQLLYEDKDDSIRSKAVIFLARFQDFEQSDLSPFVKTINTDPSIKIRQDFLDQIEQEDSSEFEAILAATPIEIPIEPSAFKQKRWINWAIRYTNQLSRLRNDKKHFIGWASILGVIITLLGLQTLDAIFDWSNLFLGSAAEKFTTNALINPGISLYPLFVGAVTSILLFIFFKIQELQSLTRLLQPIQQHHWSKLYLPLLILSLGTFLLNLRFTIEESLLVGVLGTLLLVIITYSLIVKSALPILWVILTGIISGFVTSWISYEFNLSVFGFHLFCISISILLLTFSYHKRKYRNVVYFMTMGGVLSTLPYINKSLFNTLGLSNLKLTNYFKELDLNFDIINLIFPLLTLLVLILGIIIIIGVISSLLTGVYNDLITMDGILDGDYFVDQISRAGVTSITIMVLVLALFLISLVFQIDIEALKGMLTLQIIGGATVLLIFLYAFTRVHIDNTTMDEIFFLFTSLFAGLYLIHLEKAFSINFYQLLIIGIAIGVIVSIFINHLELPKVSPLFHHSQMAFILAFNVIPLIYFLIELINASLIQLYPDSITILGLTSLLILAIGTSLLITSLRAGFQIYSNWVFTTSLALIILIFITNYLYWNLDIIESGLCTFLILSIICWLAASWQNRRDLGLVFMLVLALVGPPLFIYLIELTQFKLIPLTIFGGLIFLVHYFGFKLSPSSKLFNWRTFST